MLIHVYTNIHINMIKFELVYGTCITQIGRLFQGGYINLLSLFYLTSHVQNFGFLMAWTHSIIFNVTR